jgi:N-acetyltransferase
MTLQLTSRRYKPAARDCLQANFACITCSVCGLIYAKGEANDEKVHASFHANCTQGVKFQVRHFAVTNLN